VNICSECSAEFDALLILFGDHVIFCHYMVDFLEKLFMMQKSLNSHAKTVCNFAAVKGKSDFTQQIYLEEILNKCGNFHDKMTSRYW